MPARRGAVDGKNIKAVAQIAGVSVGTVSNVINRPEKVAAATRQRVEAVMDSIGFVRNSVAANVRLGRSQLVGLIVPDITNPFFAEVARGAVDVGPAGPAGPLALLHRPPLTITVEQYLLSACVEHHRDRPGSPYRDVGMAYLFESWAAAGSARRAAQAGFTHLIADTKRDPANARRLDRRVRRDLPELWERAHRLGGTAALAGAA